MPGASPRHHIPAWLLKTDVRAHFTKETARHWYIVFKCFTGYNITDGSRDILTELWGFFNGGQIGIKNKTKMKYIYITMTVYK